MTPDKLQSVTWNGGYKNFGYDAAGNTKTIATPSGTTILNYDQEGRLTGIVYPSSATNAFSYNGFRARMTKQDSGGLRAYTRDGADAASGIVSDNQAFHYPAGLGERRSSATYWHHGGIKNTDGRTDTAGAVLGTKRYDAFGNEKAASGSIPSPERYGGNFGYQSDGDSGLMMLGHRYYDLSIGRFLARDPIGYGKNWYSYADRGPSSKADPDGLRPINSDDRKRLHKLRGAMAKEGHSPAYINDVTNDLKKWIHSLASGESDPVEFQALWWALDHLDDKSYGAEHDGVNKCNRFVYDAFEQGAGVPMPDRSPYLRGGMQMYGANAFGDPSRDLEFLGIVADNGYAGPGYIFAFADEDSHYSGHMGLKVSGGLLVYAGGKEVKVGTYALNIIGHHKRVRRYHKYR